MTTEQPDTHQRALAINLDPTIYGTIAEIGAGQEVSAWFFRVGGAAGTVAKTISAYDMKVSDEIYGRAGRYVSRERAVAMIEYEFDLLQRRLAGTREEARFFSFADTVAARNYAGTNECHGWLGLRFQVRPKGPVNDIVLHVNMRDQTNFAQQQALGILGVNLIYAATHSLADLETFLTALTDGLSLERVEIDLIQLSGPDVPANGDCEVGLGLVTAGLALAVFFNVDGRMQAPTEMIRKRPIAIERGLFRDPEHIYPDMLQAGIDRIAAQQPEGEREPLGLMELSVNNVTEGAGIPQAEHLGRLARLLTYGFPVLLTRLRESYKVTDYLRRYSQAPLRYNLGISTLALTFAEEYYAELPGGLLEATGKLFANNVKAYAHSMSVDRFRSHLETAKVPTAYIRPQVGKKVTVESLELELPVGRLFRYLVEAGWIESVN